MISMSLSDIAILNINGSEYRCIIRGISKNEGVNLMRHDLYNGEEKWNIIKMNNLFSYIKMGKEILTLRDIEIEILPP